MMMETLLLSSSFFFLYMVPLLVLVFDYFSMLGELPCSEYLSLWHSTYEVLRVRVGACAVLALYTCSHAPRGREASQGILLCLHSASTLCTFGSAP